MAHAEVCPICNGSGTVAQKLVLKIEEMKRDHAKAEAQLAKQAPLIQAVMGLDEIDFIADDWPSEKLRESADKLRSEK